MDTTSMPGFTAEAALYPATGHYASVAAPQVGGGEPGIAPQMAAARLSSAGGPFSGSCGCGPGYCCCILCYFDRCTFWCWSTVSALPS
jgi:hypothetical protein